MNNVDVILLIKEVWPKVSKAYRHVMRKPCPVSLTDLKVSISDRGVLPGKIGRHIGPKDGYQYGSVLIIHPKVQTVVPAYTKAVVAHELIHFSLSKDKVKSHGSEFDAIADLISLPAKFRD